jgi:hypothetical protein
MTGGDNIIIFPGKHSAEPDAEPLREAVARDIAADRIRQLFGYVDPAWESGRIRNSLGSGEGVIAEVRDPVTKTKNGVEETIDEGAPDKRLMVIASEFAGLMAVMQREGSTLSAVLRDAFDRGSLGIVTKHNQTRATDALISIIGHITETELVKHMHETEMASGFANRFLFACVRRSQLLPTGGEIFGKRYCRSRR